MKPWKPWLLEVFHHHEGSQCGAYATCIGQDEWKPVRWPRFHSLTAIIKYCNHPEKIAFFKQHEAEHNYRIRNSKTNDVIPMELFL